LLLALNWYVISASQVESLTIKGTGLLLLVRLSFTKEVQMPVYLS